MKYTFVGEWNNPTVEAITERFAVVIEAETHSEALKEAARLALAHFPEAAEFESEKTFWGGFYGAEKLIDFYGDATGSLVDRDCYEIIRA
ncbi:hypothetical protein ACH41E_33360 [Streptomyces sp. NPDC020412]|uniref:hypothetical protein n=1 Tax=Streptomyces sp. NPDC020412 TaxID=3365073 RepID=UPI003791D001